jgi:glycerol-3-phosphate acyltransferase PlsY
MYPIWLRFKGGKGVACYFGGNLLIDPLLTISSMVIWIIVVKITKLSSLGALISIILLTTIQFIFMNGTLNKINVIVILILIMFKHKENIARLMSGKENKINF